MTNNPDGSITLAGLDPTWATDCTRAIQEAIDYLYAGFHGGTIWLPPGKYLVRGLILKGAVTLRGHGRCCTLIGSQQDDQTVVVLDESVEYGGLRDLFVCGYQAADARNSNAVIVERNVPALIRDCHIVGGNSALYTKGCDGSYEDLFVSGWALACILSQGANWFRRVKADTTGANRPQWGFYQGAPLMPGVMENHFDQCDFSGEFSNGSVLVDDGGTRVSITVFEGCVTSSPIALSSAQHTTFSAHEFGSPDMEISGSVAITGSYAFQPMYVPAAARSGNVGIA